MPNGFKTRLQLTKKLKTHRNRAERRVEMFYVAPRRSGKIPLKLHIPGYKFTSSRTTPSSQTTFF